MAPAACAPASSRPAQPEAVQTAQSTPSGQHDAADAAMYREMRTALCDFDSSGSPKESPPRYRAFYAALRSVLGQVLEEKTDASRHARLLAAHQWYVKHKPRPRPADMDMAAAMAASLSVHNPADMQTGVAGCNTDHSHGKNMQQQQQQQQQQNKKQFQVLGVKQQLFSSNDKPGDGACEQTSADRSLSARWHKEARLHELSDAEADLTTSSGAYSCSNSSESKAAVTAYLPEQPSLRAVPAIQPAKLQEPTQSLHSNSGGVQGSGNINTVSGKGSQSRSGACKSRSSSKAGGTAAAAAALPAADGLISIGSLPSGRFGPGSSSSNCGTLSLSCYAAKQAQWQAVAQQQQQVEDAVAAHMRSYARHRARLEEEINRKQELALMLEAHCKEPANLGASEAGGASFAGAGISSNGQSLGARVLLHVDSQHQPSQVETAYTGLTKTAGWAQRLAPVDRVKEAKQILLQDSQRECAEVTEQIAKLGIAADAEAIQHALLPPPDVPYMTCMAHLPKPGQGSSAAAWRTQKSRGKMKSKNHKNRHK